MSEFKMIKSLDLKLKKFSCMASGKAVDCIEAQELETLLSKATVVYGQSASYVYDAGDVRLTDFKLKTDTHSGLLLNYKPIKKSEPVSKAEIEALLCEWTGCDRSRALLRRINESGIK